MTKIDNFDIITPFLQFDNEYDFYYLQILQRKKENPHIGSNSRVIKNYYIKSTEYLLKYKEEIIDLCETFNARAMIRLNKRNFRSVAFKTLVNMSNSMHNQEYAFIKNCYDRACGQGHSDKNKKWILDIDDLADVKVIKCYLKEYSPKGYQYLTEIPSKSGLHIITTPFDSRDFSKVFPEVEIHRDNPVNLFIP